MRRCGNNSLLWRRGLVLAASAVRLMRTVNDANDLLQCARVLWFGFSRVFAGALWLVGMGMDAVGELQALRPIGGLGSSTPGLYSHRYSTQYLI